MKKKILIFSDWYLPGYKAGGPIQSLTNFTGVFKDTFAISMITSDTDFSENAPYPNVLPDNWTTAPDGTNTYYFSRNARKFGNLKTLLFQTDADFAYFNSMFSLFFTLFPLYILRKYKPNVQLILAPRGMLHQGALRLKSKKKKLFLFLFKLMGWHKKVIWQPTDEQEKIDIILQFGEVNISVVPNLPTAVQPPLQFPPKVKGDLKLVFLSRISEKKNLHFVINCLKNIQGNVMLDVWGNKEDRNYLAICEQSAAELPKNIVVEFKGSFPNHTLNTLIEPYHFSVLPTLGENFGHAIFESFNNGKPVFISDKTPWKNLPYAGCGWDIPLNKPDVWAQTIQRCVEMEQNEYNEWAEKTWRFAKSYRENSETKAKYLELFS